MSSFLISDTHLTHENILTFVKENGERLRPFDSVEEMDELIISNWNGLVHPKDTIYHLGDVVINRKALSILDRLNGRKVLIRGNHDIFKLRDYVKYFKDIRAYKVFPEYRIICSHIPLHPSCLERWKLNVHGHLHGNKLDDDKYISVCVEQTDYKPVPLEEIIKRANSV